MVIKRVCFLLVLLTFDNCSCQNKNQQEMKEELIEILQKEMVVYKHRPVYSCQVNKYNCRLIIELLGSKDYRFVENNGESMMLPGTHRN